MYSKVSLIGNATRDPELRYTDSGTAVTTLGLAINRKVQDKEYVTYVDIDFWGKQAEVVSEHVKKGKQLFVDGRLQQDSWEDQDGNKRSKLKVVAEDFRFLGKKDD